MIARSERRVIVDPRNKALANYGRGKPETTPETHKPRGQIVLRVSAWLAVLCFAAFFAAELVAAVGLGGLAAFGAVVFALVMLRGIKWAMGDYR